MDQLSVVDLMVMLEVEKVSVNVMEMNQMLEVDCKDCTRLL